MWEDIRRRYSNWMEQMYTNWNAGLTKDGKRKTFDYNLDRKRTVPYADVEKLVDESLSKGIFTELDSLYVKVINSVCRHTLHSGPQGHPSKRDKCAVPHKVVDKKKSKRGNQQPNDAQNQTSKSKKAYKIVYKCKRRKPQKTRSESGIYRDPYNKKLWQFSTACNDGFFNGGNAFATLFHLSNVDDKGIIPGWISKPPKVTFTVDQNNKLDVDVSLHYEFAAEHAGSYVLKYACLLYTSDAADE